MPSPDTPSAGSPTTPLRPDSFRHDRSSSARLTRLTTPPCFTFSAKWIWAAAAIARYRPTDRSMWTGMNFSPNVVPVCVNGAPWCSALTYIVHSPSTSSISIAGPDDLTIPEPVPRPVCCMISSFDTTSTVGGPPFISTRS